MTDYYTQFCVGLELKSKKEVAFFKKERERRLKDPYSDATPCEVLVEVPKEKGGLTRVYIEDNHGSGGVDDAISLLQAYLTKFAPTDCIELAWANTASRHVTEAYGGDVAYVRATRVDTRESLATRLIRIRELLLPVDLDTLSNDDAVTLIAKAKDLCQG